MHLSNILNEVLSVSWSWKSRNLINCSYNFKWHNMRQNFQIINHLLVSLRVCPTGIKVKHCSYIMNITLAFTYIFFLCYKWFTFKSFCQFHKGTHAHTCIHFFFKSSKSFASFGTAQLMMSCLSFLMTFPFHNWPAYYHDYLGFYLLWLQSST